MTGRPRTVCPPDEDLIILGEEMVDWVSIHPEILHLSEWWCIEKMFLENVWETIINKRIFIPYYEQALKIVARKYLDKTSNVREGVSQRWQRVYFKDLRKSEDKDLEDAATRGKIADNIKSPHQDQLDKDDVIFKQQAEIAALKEQLKDACIR